MKRFQSLLALLAFFAVVSVQSFSVGPGAGGGADTSSFVSTDDGSRASTGTASGSVDRRSAISNLASSVLATGFATAVVAAPSSPANAKGEADQALKGTKKDPEYEACVSKCLYECTKPKGEEQKSRTECIPECKKKCATTKAQLMTGSPIQKEE
mmetsp:Transcript_16151/g.26907  ORF Transcript_16151/g.26907 Transcript_16151/m.26907 type:complete len:155 (-) Transcript_16151:339-803(-)